VGDLAIAGSFLGGVIFPIMVIRLLPKVGFGWTMRICAFFILGLLISRSLTVSSDLQHDPNPVKMNHYFHQGINLKRLTEPPVHKTCGI